jgi:hypothetical protein
VKIPNELQQKVAAKGLRSLGGQECSTSESAAACPLLGYYPPSRKVRRGNRKNLKIIPDMVRWSVRSLPVAAWTVLRKVGLKLPFPVVCRCVRQALAWVDTTIRGDTLSVIKAIILAEGDRDEIRSLTATWDLQ